MPGTISTNHLLSKILLYLQNLDKVDKNWLRTRSYDNDIYK